MTTFITTNGNGYNDIIEYNFDTAFPYELIED